VTGVVGATGAKGATGGTGATGATGSNTTGGAVAFFGSAWPTLGGECIGSAGNFEVWPKPCPTNAQSDFYYSQGPVPAAGGSISNLQAQAGSNAEHGESWLVAVIDEKPSGAQTVAMTCTVLEKSNSCSNSGSVAIAAGDYMLVEIKPPVGWPTTWRVSFRY
jgi:hypothetical protein